MSIKTETNRLVRHAAAPLVAYAVAKEWLPEWAAGDVTELAVFAVTFAVVFLISRYKDRQAGVV